MKIIFIFFLTFFATSDIMASEWSQKANFTGQGRHRGVGISIGQKGYIGTGHHNGNGTNISYDDWWEFDPSTNSWTQKANVPTATYGSIAWGTSTKGYVGAGFVPGGVYYEFDPGTNTWSNTSSCPISGTNRDCFMVDEKGYVLSSNGMAEYNPSNDTWTIKPPCPTNVNNWSCAFETASSGFVKSNSNLYEYKPSNNSWALRATFPGLMTSGGTAFSVQGKGYIVCGYSGGLGNVTSEIWEFNPGSNTWMAMDDFPGTSRRFHVSFTIGNKGFLGTGTNGTNFNDFWQFSYDPLGTEEFKLTNANVSVFPNPVSDDFTISIGADGIMKEYEIQIRSIDGKLIQKRKTSSASTKFNRNGEKSGVYFYSIVKNDETIFSGKLIFK
jgi:N-acetylneuraminic acid mutarotase